MRCAGQHALQCAVVRQDSADFVVPIRKYSPAVGRINADFDYVECARQFIDLFAQLDIFELVGECCRRQRMGAQCQRGVIRPERVEHGAAEGDALAGFLPQQGAFHRLAGEHKYPCHYQNDADQTDDGKIAQQPESAGSDRLLWRLQGP